MRIAILFTLLVLSACNVMPKYDSLETYFASKHIKQTPSTKLIAHCHGYGCKFKQEVSLTKSEWNKIKRPLRYKTKSAEKERKNIAKSIAIFENIVGAKTGTSEDVSGTFKRTGDFQLDCADESVNTSIYLKLLENNNLLRHHTTQTPVIRGLSSGGTWFHETAVIKENKTDKLYAVDSWWKDNGNTPYIIPMKEWLNGWRPDEKK